MTYSINLSNILTLEKNESEGNILSFKEYALEQITEKRHYDNSLEEIYFDSKHQVKAYFIHRTFSILINLFNNFKNYKNLI